MNSKRFNQIVSELFKAGFSLTHTEKNFALFTDGTNTIELRIEAQNGNKK